MSNERRKIVQVLVLSDDYWHPASVPQAGLAALAGDAFTFDWITDATAWSEDRMASYPVTVLTKSNNVSAVNRDGWMSPAVEQAFVNYVRAGNGLLVIHSGSAGYQENAVLRALMGGVFLQHPPQCQVTIEPRGAHALTAGVVAFTVQDEHYHMALDDARADVFLTSKSEHGEQPAGWTRTEGRGKVCMLTPGHNLEVWLNPAYQTQIVNALHYCSAKKSHQS
jgi:type 1 glutamine amidotransferase